MAIMDNIELIDYTKIVPNELNDDRTITEEDINIIYLSILNEELHTPLKVVKIDEKSYKLIGGEVRYRALLKIFNENEEAYFNGLKLDKKIPCYVIKEGFKTKADEIIAIFTDNVRKELTKEEKLKITRRVANIWKNDFDATECKKYNNSRITFIMSVTGFSESSVKRYLKEIGYSGTNATLLKQLKAKNEVRNKKYKKEIQEVFGYLPVLKDNTISFKFSLDDEFEEFIEMLVGLGKENLNKKKPNGDKDGI